MSQAFQQQRIKLDTDSFIESLTAGIGSVTFMDRNNSIIYCEEAEESVGKVKLKMSDGTIFELKIDQTG